MPGQECIESEHRQFPGISGQTQVLRFMKGCTERLSCKLPANGEAIIYYTDKMRNS